MHFFKPYHAILLCALSSYLSLSVHRLHPRSFLRGAGGLGNSGKEISRSGSFFRPKKVNPVLPQDLPRTKSLPRINNPTVKPNFGPSHSLPKNPKTELYTKPGDQKNPSLWEFFAAHRQQSKIDRDSEIERINREKEGLDTIRREAAKRIKQLHPSFADRLSQYFKKFKERIASPTKIGGRTTTVDSDTTQAVANNRWSQILHKLKTQHAKLRDSFANAILWLTSLRTRAKDIEDLKVEDLKAIEAAEKLKASKHSVALREPLEHGIAPQTFEVGIEKLGQALAGDHLLKVEPIEGPDALSVEKLTDYLAPKPALGEELSKDASESKEKIRELLTLVQSHRRDENAIYAVYNELSKFDELMQKDFEVYAVTEEARQMKKYLETLDAEKFSQILEREQRTALSSVEKSGYTEKPADFSIPENDKENLIKDFSQLRTAKKLIQSTGRLGDLFRNLPTAGADVESEFIRYAMIIRFQTFLKDVQRSTTYSMKVALSETLHGMHPQPLTADILKPLFASTAKEDLEWRESTFLAFYSEDNLKPLQIFRKLRQPTDDAGRIKYALTKMAESLSFLSKEEADVLKATTTRKPFRKLMEQLKKNHPDKSETLVKLQAAAISIKPTNHPYAQELYEKGYIDEATLAKLNPSQGTLPQAEFESLLGTEQEFEKVLYDQFQITLLKHMNAFDLEKTQKIRNEVIEEFPQSHVDQLNSEAEAIYFQPDALAKPNSFRFDQALKKFDQGATATQELTANPLDSTGFVKAYVDAAVDPIPKVPQARISQLLDAMKIPPMPLPKPEEAELFDRLNYFDLRLIEIYEEPLEEGDLRLKGTKYEQMAQETRGAINRIALLFYSQVGKLDEAAYRVRETQPKIEKIMESFPPAEKKRMEPLINEVLKTHTSLSNVRVHLFNEDEREVLNRAVEAKQRALERALALAARKGLGARFRAIFSALSSH